MTSPESYQWMTKEERAIWKIRSTFSRHINDKKFCGVKIRTSEETGYTSFEYIYNFKTLWSRFSTRSIAQRNRKSKKEVPNV